MPGSVGHSQMQIAQDGLAWCPVEQKWKAQLQWGSTVKPAYLNARHIYDNAALLGKGT